jgi:hypothetical protein
MATQVQSNWVQDVLGVKFAQRQPASWDKARAAAITALTQLIAAITQSEHPDATRAVILLRAIRANLPRSVETKAAIDDLRYYLTSDDIIRAAETPNVFGVNIALRAPLLAALDTIVVG